MSQEYDYYYTATAGTNKIISKGPAILKGIIVGKDVSSGVLELSDHASDGNGNVKIKISSSTMLADTGGYVEVNAIFKTGITMDLAEQTDVTIIYKNWGSTI